MNRYTYLEQKMRDKQPLQLLFQTAQCSPAKENPLRRQQFWEMSPQRLTSFLFRIEQSPTKEQAFTQQDKISKSSQIQIVKQGLFHKMIPRDLKDMI